MTIRTWSGVSYTSVGKLIKQILDYYPGDHGSLYITSSYRAHTPGSHHGGRLYYGGSRTAAVDIGFGYGSSGATARGRALADWLMKFRGDEVELIHSPRHYVKNTRVVGPYSVSLHYNHVHIAMSETQARRVLARLRGGKVPSGGGGSSKNGPAGSVKSVGFQQKHVNSQGYTPKLKVDRKWGPATEAGVKWYQRRIGVTADGVWGKATDAAHKKYMRSKKAKAPAASKTKPKKSTSAKLKVDGKIGPATYRKLQKELGVTVDGVFGPKSVRALQKRIGAKQDGQWGSETTRKLQEYLNRR